MENTLAYDSRTLITDAKGVIAQALGAYTIKIFTAVIYGFLK